MTLEDKKKRAESLDEAGKFSESVVVWQEIVQEKPEANAWWGYGKALRSSKQFAEAAIALREMLKISPSFPPGWAVLADCYRKLAKPEEAEKAALHAIRLKPDYTYAYKLISEFREENKDWNGQVEILTRLLETGKADDTDLNALGIAHANLHNFGEAIRFYKLAYRASPSVYPLFNLGLIYEKIGQRLDALDTYHASLRLDSEYAKAKKAIDRVQQALVTLDKSFHREVAPTLPTDEWYRYYINPFELLGADRSDDLSNFEVRKLAGLKKRVLHGIALDDGKAETLGGHVVDASVVEDAYREILDETKRLYHWTVFENEHLLMFLTRGDLRHFLYEAGASPFGVLDKVESDPEFRIWLSEIFAKQYNHVLGNCLKNLDASAVEALLDGRRWIEPEHDDVCFERAHRLVGEMLQPIQQIRDGAKTNVPQLESIREVLIGDPHEKKRLRILAKLPTHFRDQINDLITAIRSIAIDCHNKHDHSALSYEILKIAQHLPIRDSKLGEQIKEDLATIDKIVKEEEASRFEALIQKNMLLRVNKRGVEYGARHIRPQEVRSLSWGVYIHRVNGVKSQHNYSISIGGTSGVLEISWDCSGLLMGLAKKMFREKDAVIPVCDQSEGDQDACFGRIVDALFGNVGTVLLGHIISEFEAGRSLRIGECTLSKNGAAFQTGIFFKDDHQIPWSDLETASGNGEISLCHRFKRSTSISFAAKTTPNAVLLPALCRILKK